MIEQDRFDIAILDSPARYAPPPALDSGGGECVFLGRTRLERHPVHGELRRLSYDAYKAMAINQLRRLADDAARRHGAMFIRIHHSVGDVPVGQASVLIQVVCGRRDAAFTACRELIDRLKAEVPIWKREVWADGSTWSEGTPVAPRGLQGEYER